jgi:hypothetical protein
MRREYTLDKMLEGLEKWVEKYKEQGYTVERNPKELPPARVPLYCVKKEGVKIVDEMVFEITNSATISKDGFFPPLDVKGTKVTMLETSPVRFYQYYRPKAKIFFAYPDYVEENAEFKEFKKVCEKRGIGLLKTSETKIEVVLKSRSLFDEICIQLVNNKKKREDIEAIVGNYLENYLHYLVYYPAPVYGRRAITGRTVGDLSFILIDKLLELKNVTYKEELKKLASDYRQEARDDYQIALDTIKKLWVEVSGVKYPEIQRQLEDILLRNPEYRDHFLHQFQVFLLGAYIIDKLYDHKEKCITEFKESYECGIENAWLLASTYHDFNYSIQEYDLWIKEFFPQALSISQNAKCTLSPLNLDVAFIRENFLLKTQEICKVLNIEMNDIVMNFFYEEATTRRNHGLLSALSLLKLFENTAQDKINRSGLIQAEVFEKSGV